jgi:hypothetical protein
VHIHRTASWPARDDRRAALVWLAIFWIFVGVGFGFDLHNYLHEQPPVPTFVLDSVVRDVSHADREAASCLLGEAKSYGAGVGFVFGETADDALLGQVVGLSQDEVESWDD